jgi:hypothetical protein
MWNVKTKVTPVIIGTTGTTPKSFRKYLRKTSKKHETKELQKTDIGTAHVIREVLMYKYETFMIGYRIIFTKNCNHTKTTT